MSDWQVLFVYPDLLAEDRDLFETLIVGVMDPDGMKWGGNIKVSYELLTDPAIDFGAFFIAMAQRNRKGGGVCP